MLKLYSVNKEEGKLIMKLIIASNNQGKIREMKEILSPLGYEPVSMKEAGIEIDIVEDGETFSENARIKAQAIYEIAKMPVLADDSGLAVDFLDGAPGVYSARYAGENATDKDRMNKLLEELEGIDKSLRGAKFVCSLYFIKDEKTEICVSGECHGFIGEEPIGDNGFGYDPIFMIDDDVSMACIPAEEKNKISHRAKALEELVKELSK